MIEDGTGIRHHAKAFGDVGTVIPPIILYLKAEVTGCNCDKCKFYIWYYDWCKKWRCEVDGRTVYPCFEQRT